MAFEWRSSGSANSYDARVTVVKNIVLVLHLLGMAAIIGGYLVARRDRVVSAAGVWGARAQLVTGVILVGILEATKTAGHDPNQTKFGVKLLVAIGVAACWEIAAARKRKDPSTDTNSLVTAGAALTVVNVAVAALWT